jgi:transposase
MKKKIKIFKEEILKHNPNNIISIDESSFDTNISKINGWNVKGKRIINKRKDNQRKRITLILGITKNKVVGYKIINGSANKIHFEDFLKNEILNKNKKSNILLMDNARIHHALTVKDYIKNTENKIIYNVPYNPETNPIEYVFSAIKNKVRKKNNSKIDKLKKNIIQAINNINKITLKNTFMHSINI